MHVSHAFYNQVIYLQLCTCIHIHSQDVHELQVSPASREPTPTDQFRTNYAQLTFEGVRPRKPPPLECEVTYTEALAPGGRIVSVQM